MGGRKRGQVLVIFALALLILLGFVALGIDVGYMYSVRNDLQRSLDSGALAGAFAFHDGGWVSGSVPGPLEIKAKARAKSFATLDPVGAAPLDSALIKVTFPEVNTIRVEVPIESPLKVNLFFGGFVGKPTVDLIASATALAEPVDTNIECLTPLAFPYPFTDLPPGAGNGKWDPGEEVPITQGWQGTFQVADTPVSGIDNYVQIWAGEIFPLTLCSDTGSVSDLQNRIIDPCWDGCNAISINDTVNPMPGPVTFDPTIDTINGSIIPKDPQSGVSWDSGSNLPVSTSYPDDNWLFSPRVMRVMLYDPQETAPGGSHPGVIKVDRFAGFWVWNADNSGTNRFMTGYLVPDSAVGDTVGSPPILIEPSLKTTRLIQ